MIERRGPRSMSGALSRLRMAGAVALLAVGVAAASCSSSPGPGTGTGSGGEAVGVLTKAYNSSSGLLGDTKVAVVGTVRSVRQMGALGDGSPEWRFQVDVLTPLKGGSRAGDVLTAVGVFGRSARVAPMKAGRTYILLLGHDPSVPSGELALVGGVYGVFSVDQGAQAVTSLAPRVDWLPQSLSLSLAEVELGGAPTTTLSTTTTTSGGSTGGCPPGCQLATSFDAVTWLASQSTSVAIDVAEANPDSTSVSQYPTVFAVQQNLEHTLGVGTTILPTGSAAMSVRLHRGQDYVVFISLGRGGPCISMVYSYNRSSQVASLVGEYRTSIPLAGGRTLPVPQTVTLSQLKNRMYPVGQVVQSTDASESLCPE